MGAKCTPVYTAVPVAMWMSNDIRANRARADPALRSEVEKGAKLSFWEVS